jgi:hypothetical protein
MTGEILVQPGVVILYRCTLPAVALFGPALLDHVEYRYLGAVPPKSALSAIVPFGCPATAVQEVPPFVDIHKDCPPVSVVATKILCVALPVVALVLSIRTKLQLAVVLKEPTCAQVAP